MVGAIGPNPVTPLPAFQSALDPGTPVIDQGPLCHAAVARLASSVSRPRINRNSTFLDHHIGNVPGDDAMVLDVLFAIALLFVSAIVLFGFLASKPRDAAFLIVGGFMLTAIGAVWLFS
jgi:hypothetical protein